jgi:hypothetical protein
VFPFERPYPDELVSGALVRGCKHFRISLPALGEQLGLNSHWRPSFLGWTSPDALAQLFRMDAAAVLWRHTMHPYLTAFQGSNRARIMCDSSTGTNQAGTQKAALFRATLNAVAVRRFCAQCLRNELRTRGESYWHRAHHLPGVHTCHVHGIGLRQTTIATAGPFSALTLPHEVSGRVISCRTAAACAQEKLTARSLEVLRLHKGPEARPADFYLSLAREHGWLAPGGDVDAKQLGEAFASFWGRAFLRSLCADFPLKSDCWPALMLRAQVLEPFATCKHLLIETFLRHATPQRELVLTFAGRSASPNTWCNLDARVFSAVQTKLRQVIRAGAPATKRALLEAAGVWHSYRHNADSLPRSKNLVTRFQQSAWCARPRIAAGALPLSSTSCPQRSELVRAGLLIGARQLAARLGVPCGQLKVMAAQGRLLCVQFRMRNFYPAFWADGAVSTATLEGLALALHAVPGYVAYGYLTTPTLHTNNLSALEIARSDPARAIRAAREFAAHAHGARPRSSHALPKRPALRA